MATVVFMATRFTLYTIAITEKKSGRINESIQVDIKGGKKAHKNWRSVPTCCIGESFEQPKVKKNNNLFNLIFNILNLSTSNIDTTIAYKRSYGH